MDVTYEETFRTVELPDGTTVAYNEAGSGDISVILIHGSGPGATGWSNFNPNIGNLADYFHVFAVTMPGWGESSPRPAAEYRHDEVLVQFMDALGIDKAALVLSALESGPATLANLVSATHLARPTAHRIAVALEYHSLVTRDSQGRFVLGPRLAELASAAGEDHRARAIGSRCWSRKAAP